MEIIFRIHYNTQWGENLRIHFTTDPDQPCSVINLSPIGDGYWEHTLVTDHKELFYRYEFTADHNMHILEKEFRYLKIHESSQIYDTWRYPASPANALYSAAFMQAIFKHNQPINQLIYTGSQLIVRLREIRLNKDEIFCLVSQQHGNWDTQNPYLLHRAGESTWDCILEKPLADEVFTFKFGLWNLKGNQFACFEDGPNRQININPNGGAIIINIDGFRYSHYWRGAGVAVPVFSLRTERSVGCGEFGDLIPLAKWCQNAGLKMIQLLPINDTMATQTWVDTYPYNAISVMAFHPMYINVEEVFEYYKQTIPEELQNEALSLNHEALVDYERTMKWKMSTLRTIYQATRKETLADPGFKHYCQANQWWVHDYAVFSLMRDRHQTPDFRHWPAMSSYDKNEVQALINSNTTEAQEAWFYIFIQFHLQKQLDKAIGHAHNLGIAFKGDLPIGINPNSVEAWVDASQFNFGLQAGAPPDFFSASGQNWGFPTYNWEAMKKDDYAWWQQRLGRMQQFFDAFRIDHILGFFRIWSIPKPFTDGIMGHFDPALPMSSQELKQFNFMGNPAYFTLPVVDRYYIDTLTGSYAQVIDDQMFVPTAFGHRQMKREFFNPIKIQDWLNDHVAENDRPLIFKALQQLMREILFIQANDNHWHPRIMLTESRLFNQLSQPEQVALRQIHEHYFYNRHNEFWKHSATERLEGTLKKCKMLVCGEDLGMIPASVPEVMQKLQILSLEIQRMPKDINNKFGNTWQYPYLSVCTTSTHDISSMRGWWEENRNESAFYYYNILHCQGEVPQQLSSTLANSIIQLHLQSPSMWCILPLQDIAAMDDEIPKLPPAEERINEPGIQHHYWRYRIPFYIDKLHTNNKLHNTLKKIISIAGR